jgi:hypothetical protein
MGEVWICLGVAALAFASGLVGLRLQALLPEHHTSDRSRDMIGAMIGLFSLLLALALGTLIGSAYGFFSIQKSEMETFCSRAIQLDLALAEYGPETAPARARMKETFQGLHDVIWGNGQSAAAARNATLGVPLVHLRAMDEFIANLNPQTPAQRQFAAAAGVHASFIEQTRVLIAMQLASPTPWPMVLVVVSWALILFCGYGLLSRVNATTLAALALGAFAVASAIFLILDLNAPFSGLFRLPSAGFEQMLATLGG